MCRIGMGQAARLLAVGAAAALLLGMGVPAALAGGPVAKDVPADARGYMHVDVAALRGTELFKALRDGAPGAGMVQPGLRLFGEITGVHPLRDLDGVTLYTTTLGDREGVMLLYGKFTPETVEQHVRQFARHAELAYNGHTVHTWWDEKNERTVAGTVYSEGLLVSADSVDRLKAALDVLDGKKPGGSALVKGYPKGALFHAAAEGLGVLAARSESQVLRNTKSVDLTVEEKAGTVTATLTLELRAERFALQFKRFAEGIKAAVAMNEEQAPAAAKLMDAVTVVLATPTTVTITFSHPSKDLLPDLKAAREEREARAAATATKPAGAAN